MGEYDTTVLVLCIFATAIPSYGYVVITINWRREDEYSYSHSEL